MRRRLCNLFLMILLSAFFITLWSMNLMQNGRFSRLDGMAVLSSEYREHNLDENFFEFVKGRAKPGKYVGIYMLESKYGYERFPYDFTTDVFEQLEKDWSKQKEWDDYIENTKSIWDDVRCFPVPEFTGSRELTVSYVNTWMSERSYGGKRGHEGCDLMASKNERGLYPIISMTDGVVENKGWLEKGGYRIGIKSPAGAYFYYAHLDSYSSLEEGDVVKAGDILGFMGDSGYGPEGTTGQFPVHLHLGIYIYPEAKETSVNPYWVLRYLEKHKVKCYTEK